MPFLGRAPSASITNLEDADQDTKIQVEESSDEDTIRFDIAGAEDFTMTANAFNVLSGSTLNVASGATIANSGTATGFGAASGAMAMEVAFAGVLQANANFVDQVIFGPAVDGQSWNGFWDKAGVYSSLMLATIEDEGSNTEINIWDLTEQTSGVISTTPLATVDLANAATPTGIAAAMGYLIVGSEDGIAIIDPHSGAWAERTQGWPRTLSTSTIPALTNNDVAYVAAGIAPASPLDPRTGGPMPSFAVAYGTGADVSGLIKYDGNVHNKSGTIESSGQSVAIYPQGYIANTFDTGDRVDVSNTPISEITADDWGANQSMSAVVGPNGFGATNGMNVSGDLMVGAHANGLTFSRGAVRNGGATGVDYVTAMVNRTYNTGFLHGDIRGAWLANSKTVDRSYKANTLTENGTVTEAAVASGSELMGYSGFTGSNYFSRAYDADLDFGTTFSVIGWFKTTGTDATEYFFERKDPSDTARQFRCSMFTSGAIEFEAMNAAANLEFSVTTSTSRPLDDSLWHQIAMWRDGKNAYMYIDGALVASDTENITDTHADSNATLAIGNSVGAGGPATTTTMALWRFSATVPTATQVREMYEAEKGMFVASAECLLQSGSTDAVIDVDVDPLSGKVIVTQTDAITIFDGLVVDSKPTVNSGASEKGKLWGDLRAEQNAANAYVTAPATDQRQVNEMVRGLASDLPAGVDMGKAKAWCVYETVGTLSILASYNVKSITDAGTGETDIAFGIPFKSTSFVAVADGQAWASPAEHSYINHTDFVGGTQIRVRWANASAGVDSGYNTVVCFGELENE
jgi:hypothetical protein